jgi:hypothetical protein
MRIRPMFIWYFWLGMISTISSWSMTLSWITLYTMHCIVLSWLRPSWYLSSIHTQNKWSSHRGCCSYFSLIQYVRSVNLHTSVSEWRSPTFRNYVRKYGKCFNWFTKHHYFMTSGCPNTTHSISTLTERVELLVTFYLTLNSMW